MSSNINVNQLFQSAQEEGILSPASAQTLIMPNIGAQFAAGLGIPADQVHAAEVILVTKLIDDSGSIKMANNVDAMIDGGNSFDSALQDAKESDNILVTTRYLNGKVLYPYTPLDQVTKMTSANYQATGGTPLYDQTVETLRTVMAKYLEFRNNGVTVRTITIILTDGQDEHSRRYHASDVANVVQDMLLAEDHIIQAIGFNNGRCDFKRVFSEMGIPDQWIMDTANNPSAIRQACRVASRSAAMASKSAAGFSKVAIGGFGAP